MERAAPKRCAGGVVGDYGECLFCDAEQGVACRAPAERRKSDRASPAPAAAPPERLTACEAA